MVTINSLIEENAKLTARVAKLEDENDEWRDASGLCDEHGDPGGITPERMKAFYDRGIQISGDIAAERNQLRTDLRDKTQLSLQLGVYEKALIYIAKKDKGHVCDREQCGPGLMEVAAEALSKTFKNIPLGVPVPQPTYDLVEHLFRQMAFSHHTFGPGDRLQGLLAHIRKDLVEVEKTPKDVIEWINIVLLALDGAWRSGHSPAEIASALEAKLTKNEKRKWPDWRTVSSNKPIEHVRKS